MAEHSSAINTRGNAAAVLRQGREDFFVGARRNFSRGAVDLRQGRGGFEGRRKSVAGGARGGREARNEEGGGK